MLTTPVRLYTLGELLATGNSMLGCVHGVKHHEAWAWRGALHRYVCQACAPCQTRREEDEEVAS